MRELVTESIVRGAEWLFASHQVDNDSCRANKEDFHQGVVYANEVHEKVHIAHAEDEHVDFLGLARKA